MKITLENQQGIYTVEIKDEVESITEYRDFLLIPVLNAAGFSTALTDAIFFDEAPSKP